MHRFLLNIAFILLSLCQCRQVLAQCTGSDWTGQVTLHEPVDYTLKYKVQEERLVIRLRASTTGFLGFGLSEAGHMLGSDIVTVAIVNGEARVEDRLAGWAPFTFDDILQIETPKVDAAQSWEVECALESGGYTTVIISRSLVTADCADRNVIEGDTFVIFAWSSDDLVTYHGANRGSTIVNFFAAPPPETFTPPADADSTIELVLNDFVLAERVTQYVLQLTDFGAENKHIVAVEPLIREEDKEFVHHILVHDCGSAATSPAGLFQFPAEDVPYLPPGNISPIGFGPCQNLVMGWAKGGGPVTFPENTGIRTGDDGARWVILEVHIDNSLQQSGNIISSGVRLHLASELREHDIGTLVVGNPKANFPTLPAGEERVHREATCTSDCTETFSGQINLVLSFPHMHSYGKEIWTTLNGEVISSKEYWNFGFQNQITISQTVNPGDVLSTHCVYDTTLATDAVLFGLESTDEMCMDFISYWPKSNFNGLNCGWNTGGKTICGFTEPIGTNPIPDGEERIPSLVSVGFNCSALVEEPSGATPTSAPTTSPTSGALAGNQQAVLSLILVILGAAIIMSF